MKEEEVRVFIDGCTHYFEHIGATMPKVSAPYILDGDPQIFDYTGIIGVTGACKGSVYFTAEENILASTLETMGESNSSSEMLSDMVGEITNTISGNVRQTFGANFVISVPAVIGSKEGTVRVPADENAFVVPLVWDAGKGALILVLK